ncbi:MAG: radical SAM protein [Oscillospiraceae bacterium]
MLALTTTFFLRKDVKLVIGYRCAALYDLPNKKIYLVSKDNGEKLQNFDTQNDINQVLKDKLIKLNLGTFGFLDAEIQPLYFEYPQFDDSYTGSKCTLLYIEVTDNCNLNCIHCYAEIERGGRNNLTIDNFNTILSQLPRDYSCDIRLTGGEPFLNPHITELMELVHSKVRPHNKHSIVTNGTFNVSDALLAMSYGFELQISIYGIKSSTFAKFTNSSVEIWQRVMDNLIILSSSENKSNILLCYAVNELTYSELNDFIEFAQKYGFRYILNRPASTGRAVKNWDLLQLTPNEHYEFARNTKASELRCCYHLCQLHLTVIDFEGNVIPCSFLRRKEFHMGNIYNESLEEIWNSKKYMAFRGLTPSKVDKCSKCEFIYACSAGCCGEASGFNNDILSSYPWCYIKPYDNTYLQVSDEDIYRADKLAAGTFDFYMEP